MSANGARTRLANQQYGARCPLSDDSARDDVPIDSVEEQLLVVVKRVRLRWLRRIVEVEDQLGRLSIPGLQEAQHMALIRRLLVTAAANHVRQPISKHL